MDNWHGFFSLLCLGRAATVQTYHPTKKLSIFSFLSPVFGEHPPKHAVDEESEESIVQRPNGQVRSFRGPPSRPSFSTGPWSSCIVTGHGPVDDRHESENNGHCCAHCMHAACQYSRSTLIYSSSYRLVLVQQATACGLPEVFHVSPRPRSIARVDLRRWCDQMHASDRSEVFRDRLHASKRRHMARCCVCMQVNETGHAQRMAC